MGPQIFDFGMERCCQRSIFFCLGLSLQQCEQRKDGNREVAQDVSFCHTHDLCLEQMRLRLHAL